MMQRAMDKGPCVCGGRECAGKAANSCERSSASKGKEH
jgi:hypothetical protein